MQQVPHYLCIGNGRVAKHFKYYFTALGLSHSSWDRKTDSAADLQAACKAATHILILISDAAIVPFIQEHLKNSTAIRIHCSASVMTKDAYAAHPLMCFNDACYTLEQYGAIPFVIDEHAPDFSFLFPGLPNPHARLKPELKNKYHALCVLSANFSCMLWRKFFSSLEQEFQLPRTIGYPYLRQQTENLLKHAETALSGPLVRKDKETIEKNIKALQNDPFQAVYQSFVNCYAQLNEETNT
jgi:2-dehydropantoate 2-reductase